MVAFHRFLAWIAFYSHAFGNLIKGTDEILIRDGELLSRELRNNHVTKHDLQEDLRLALHAEDLARIRSARLERSGTSFFCMGSWTLSARHAVPLRRRVSHSTFL